MLLNARIAEKQQEETKNSASIADSRLISRVPNVAKDGGLCTNINSARLAAII